MTVRFHLCHQTPRGPRLRTHPSRSETEPSRTHFPHKELIRPDLKQNQVEHFSQSTYSFHIDTYLLLLVPVRHTNSKTYEIRAYWVKMKWTPIKRGHASESIQWLPTVYSEPSATSFNYNELWASFSVCNIRHMNLILTCRYQMLVVNFWFCPSLEESMISLTFLQKYFRTNPLIKKQKSKERTSPVATSENHIDTIITFFLTLHIKIVR